MAHEPTPEEILAFTDLASVMRWAQLPGDATDATSPQGAFAVLLGAPHTDHWRGLSSIPEAALASAISGWAFNGSPASLWHQAQATAAGRAARIAAGVQLRTEQIQHNAQVALYISQSNAQRALAQASPPPTPGPTAKVKMTETVDQFGFGAELAVDNALLDQGQEVYTTIFGDLPAEEEDITGEQITALRAQLGAKRFYVDFGVFGPFGTRLTR